jgi:hypothetical protein
MNRNSFIALVKYVYVIYPAKASCPVDTRGSFPGVKPPGHEANHSPSSCAEVKNAWSYTSTSPYVFMAWFSVRLHGGVLN